MRSVSVLLLCGLSVWSGCMLKPEAVGSDHEVVVVVSSRIWDRCEESVRAIFERTVATPQREPVFTLRVVGPEDFDFYRKFRNVLILTPLSGEDETASLVNSLLSGPARAQILSGEAYVFQKKDIWAREQTLTVLTGPDEATLADTLEMKGDEIYEFVAAALDEHVKTWLYKKGEQKQLGEKLYRKYGWTIRVPQGYWVDREDPDRHFVFLRKSVPDRWLFVYWEEAESPDLLTEEWCLGTRAEIGSTFYGGDAIVGEYTRVERTTFNGREAHRITGLWQNDTPEAGYAAGGPFYCYGFHDSHTKRLYLVDGAVFAPGMNKEPYLRQLDIIAHTFRTKGVHAEGS